MAKLRARWKAYFSARQRRQSGRIACPATGETNGRPQHWHMGSFIVRNEPRHDWQMGIRLASRSVVPQTRHGAGKTTAASASSARRRMAMLVARRGALTLQELARRGYPH